MPEAPDLQVVKEVLQRRLVGQKVTSAQVVKPTVLRSLASEDFAGDISGRRFESVERRGKFLLLGLSGDRHLAINPMLTGGLWYCSPSEWVLKRVCIILTLDGGQQLRYFDEREMGMVYYTASAQLAGIPRLKDQGPDVLDEPLTFEGFCDRLRKLHGEIKGILTRGRVVSGIGNAYADEVLFAAGIFPFRKRRTLSEEELRRLHQALYTVPAEAVEVLRERMGEDIHLKIRDFLRIHGKGDQPCPQCGGAVTTISANQRLTNYCRRCQPGMLLRN